MYAIIKIWSPGNERQGRQYTIPAPTYNVGLKNNLPVFTDRVQSALHCLKALGLNADIQTVSQSDVPSIARSMKPGEPSPEELDLTELGRWVITAITDRTNKDLD
jgi:hypothetical protein